MSAKDRLFCTEHTFPVDGIGKVTIRDLSEDESDKVYDGMIGEDKKITDPKSLRRRVVSLCVKAIDGEPVELSEEEVRKIKLPVFSAIWQEVGARNGLIEDEQPGNSTAEPST